MKFILGMSVLMWAAFNANAADRLPRCIGSQATHCVSDDSQSSGPFVKCNYYKAGYMCGDFTSDGTGCRVEYGEMFCPTPKAAAVAQTMTGEGDGSSTINFESSEVDACIAGSSLAATQAQDLAHTTAMSGCPAHRVDSSKTAASFMIRPTGRGQAECVSHVSVTCVN